MNATLSRMAVDKSGTMPVRISDEAVRWARIASGYTGESVAAYISRIVLERARDDADRLHAEIASPPPRPAAPKRSGGGK